MSITLSPLLRADIEDTVQEKITGVDIEYTSPDGEQVVTFQISGYGCRPDDKKKSWEFAKTHPDWVRRRFEF